MRPIEFRAWNGKSFYMPIYCCGEWYRDGRSLEYANPTNDVVEQFTGLHDKNGVKIFEGDILDEDGSLFIVAWDDDWAKLKLQYSSPKSIQYPEWNRGKKMIIAGNIHQNPELLEQ